MIHSFVYKHGVAPRKKAVTCNSHHHQGISLSADIETWIDFEKTRGRDLFCKSVPSLSVKIDPTDENKRKAEISRDFSAFFIPKFFRISIYPFWIFRQPKGIEVAETHFFTNFISKLYHRKDLNPRQGLGLFRFFVLVTKCLQTDDYKPDLSIHGYPFGFVLSEGCCHIRGLGGSVSSSLKYVYRLAFETTTAFTTVDSPMPCRPFSVYQSRHEC